MPNLKETYHKKLTEVGILVDETINEFHDKIAFPKFPEKRMLYERMLARKKGTQKLNRLFIIALFGAIIFVVNVFLLPPLNYLLIVVEAVLLALSGLFIPKGGASYVGAVGGLLTAVWSPALGLFTFVFAFLFGVFVDARLRWLKTDTLELSNLHKVA